MSGGSTSEMLRCAEADCGRRAWFITRRCLPHTVLHEATAMPADDLAALRRGLEEVTPLTAAERRGRRVHSALNNLADAAKRHRMAHHSALLAGAEREQALSTTEAAYEHIDELEARAAEAKRSTT